MNIIRLAKRLGLEEDQAKQLIENIMTDYMTKSDAENYVYSKYVENTIVDMQNEINRLTQLVQELSQNVLIITK